MKTVFGFQKFGNKKIHPASKFLATEPILDYALGKSSDIAEKQVTLKMIARNSDNDRLAALAAIELGRMGDVQALESIAGYAHSKKVCMLALSLLERKKEYDSIMNAIFSSNDHSAIKHGLKILIRNECVEHLKELFSRANHKIVKKMVAESLVRMIDLLIERKDVEALAHIAKSKQEEWMELRARIGKDVKLPENNSKCKYEVFKLLEDGKTEEVAELAKKIGIHGVEILSSAIEFVDAALERKDMQLLSSIARGVEREFLGRVG